MYLETIDRIDSHSNIKNEIAEYRNVAFILSWLIEIVTALFKQYLFYISIFFLSNVTELTRLNLTGKNFISKEVTPKTINQR